MLRALKGRAERAIIASSYEAPIPLHQTCQLRLYSRFLRSCGAPQIDQWRRIEQLHRP
jgi:hypothetical protein